ncbi:uncharacterized protein BDR25DRAFT_395978 [Lindgomyces ingoldianus]|uniref:Uncharacterized protein n=1 Tax=Lindgomyces ingoldianus TaxID=673940 RepID=A0ACB6QI79_9PLEO|nr:uncharacterized protein BDR25DRAFT_395978 [Lindgomyces ingoldianus]KAF2465846.1 hypothetical protein BDR25DRAFT_395978 [Lindgomyces ingoldianus]
MIRHQTSMETRHSSPSTKAASPRPRIHRQRSNSFPMVEVLGCSTAEAKIILAEGRAALRTRSVHRRRGRNNRSAMNKITTIRHQDHMLYLSEDSAVIDQSEDQSEDQLDEGQAPDDDRSLNHSRALSNVTDRSTSTVTGPTLPSSQESLYAKKSPTSPLGDYSANLAKFIQSQLNSIPSYKTAHPLIYPRSCPDLSSQLRTPPQSPTWSRRPVEMESILELPPMRPPLRSQFSEWSSTDDENDDEAPQVPDIDPPRKDSKASDYAPSILRYYEKSSAGSFLLESTPPEDEGRNSYLEVKHPFAEGPHLPNQPVPSQAPSEADLCIYNEHGYPSSVFTGPKLTSSSAPSFSSTSTASYFDCKRPISFTRQIRDRTIVEVSPHQDDRKILTAISPFEGGALTNVHDIFVESQQKVVIEGLSFDLLMKSSNALPTLFCCAKLWILSTRSLPIFATTSYTATQYLSAFFFCLPSAFDLCRPARRQFSYYHLTSIWQHYRLVSNRISPFAQTILPPCNQLFFLCLGLGGVYQIRLISEFHQNNRFDSEASRLFADIPRQVFLFLMGYDRTHRLWSEVMTTWRIDARVMISIIFAFLLVKIMDCDADDRRVDGKRGPGRGCPNSILECFDPHKIRCYQERHSFASVVVVPCKFEAPIFQNNQHPTSATSTSGTRACLDIAEMTYMPAILRTQGGAITPNIIGKRLLSLALYPPSLLSTIHISNIELDRGIRSAVLNFKRIKLKHSQNTKPPGIIGYFERLCDARIVKQSTCKDFSTNNDPMMDGYKFCSSFKYQVEDGCKICDLQYLDPSSDCKFSLWSVKYGIVLAKANCLIGIGKSALLPISDSRKGTPLARLLA